MYKFTKLLMRASSSFCASATASSVPITVISSWSLSSGVGKIILAPVLSRTFRMFPPPFPIRNLWYSGLARSSAVWLLVCYKLNIGQSVVLEVAIRLLKHLKRHLQQATFSSAKDSSCFLAFSTSSAGPLIVTASMPEPSVGKWMCTPPHSSMMERTKRPLEPIRELCSFDGMDTSTSVMFA